MLDFEEHQRFRQRWLLLLLAVVVASAWVPLLVELLGDGSDEPLWALFVYVALAGALLPGWILYLKLSVVVDGEAVHIRFRGLPVNRRIRFHEITEFEAITYRPVVEYGGWGVRWRGRGKIAYSVSGNEGVRLSLDDEKEVLVGSFRAEGLASVLAARVRR